MTEIAPFSGVTRWTLFRYLNIIRDDASNSAAKRNLTFPQDRRSGASQPVR